MINKEWQANGVALLTITGREVRRFTRIWAQTLLPPGITMVLYFVIFGELIGQRIGTMDGVRYIEYIIPGLVMMSVITNSYSNVASSFFSTKFQHSIEEMLVAPMSPHIILLGFVIGGVARGLAVGVIVSFLSLFFTDLQLQHPVITLLVVILTATIFALAGFVNAVFAHTFDDISIVPTFVLTPLTYLGGVFYSIHQLPELWQNLSQLNPIWHMVSAFRYGLLGVSDVNISLALILMSLAIIVLYLWGIRLLTSSAGMRQ